MYLTVYNLFPFSQLIESPHCLNNVILLEMKLIFATFLNFGNHKIVFLNINKFCLIFEQVHYLHLLMMYPLLSLLVASGQRCSSLNHQLFDPSHPVIT